ncbi:MAG TPA: methyltransferase domain-containing protein [Bacillota bacterium]
MERSDPGAHHHGHGSKERREQRARLLPVDAVLAGLLRSDAEILADLGCGYGFFTIPAAKRLRRGRVVALDTDPEALDEARKGFAEAGLTNVEFVLSRPDRIPLADGSVTAALLSTVLHEVGDKPRFLTEVRRILSRSGRLSVVEFHKQEMPFGPPLGDRLTEEQTADLLRGAGLVVVETSRLSDAFYQVIAEVGPVTSPGAVVRPEPAEND